MLMQQTSAVYHDDPLQGYGWNHREIAFSSILSYTTGVGYGDIDNLEGYSEIVSEGDAVLQDFMLPSSDGDMSDWRLWSTDHPMDYCVEALREFDEGLLRTPSSADWEGTPSSADWEREGTPPSADWEQEGEQLCLVRQSELTTANRSCGARVSMPEISLCDLELDFDHLLDLDQPSCSEFTNANQAHSGHHAIHSLPAFDTLMSNADSGLAGRQIPWDAIGADTRSPSSVPWTSGSPGSPDSGAYSSSSSPDLEFPEELKLSFLKDLPGIFGGKIAPATPQSLPANATVSSGPRRPGRPRKLVVPGVGSFSDGKGGCEPQGRVSKRKCGQNKSTHLWEFMRKLLEDPEYNPHCIKWENKDQGVFRIVPGRSKIIAGLWGQRKNNPTMTFDKLSRSLRWCRTYGFLSEVPKNDGYPKKLCFRFGERALAWKN